MRRRSSAVPALRIQPDHVGAHYNLGCVLYYQNKADEAITEFRTITRLAAKHPLADYMLGVACTQKGLYGEALAAFRRLMSGAPGTRAGIYPPHNGYSELSEWSSSRKSFHQS